MKNKIEELIQVSIHSRWKATENEMMKHIFRLVMNYCY